MANYEDYQLDEMENSAVNKSKNLKRGLAAGAAVLAAGGTAAYGASEYMAETDSEAPELTADDLLAGANAGTDDTPQEEPAPAQPAPQQVHVNHHIVTEPVTQAPQVPGDPEINVDETAFLLDENGEVVSVYDRGTIDGMDWVAIDSDLNGKADLLGIDENRNGVIEDHEIHEVDNKSYSIGQGNMYAGYVRTPDGEVVKIFEEPNPNNERYYADNEPVPYSEDGPSREHIHNDFDDERTGESYHGDLAENNGDYNNRGGEQYSASMEEPNQDELIYEPEEITLSEESQAFLASRDNGEVSLDEDLESYPAESGDDYTASSTEDYGQEDYGYDDRTDDMASFDSPADSFDDPVVFDA